MSFKDNETPSEPLFKNYNILNFNKLIFLTQAKFMFQLINKQTPECIDNVFNTKSKTNRPVRNTKIGHNFVPLFRTKIKERFITNTGKQIWNEVPDTAKKHKHISLFSKHCTKYLSDL